MALSSDLEDADSYGIGKGNHRRGARVLFGFYVLLGIFLGLLATGHLFPEWVHPDRVAYLRDIGINADLIVPPQLYLYSSLGAVAWVMIIALRSPFMVEGKWEYAHRQLLRAGYRIPLAILLVTGLYLLIRMVGFHPSLEFLILVSFLIGLRVQEAFLMFDAAGKGLRSIGENAPHREYYLGALRSDYIPFRGESHLVEGREFLKARLLILTFFLIAAAGAIISTGYIFPGLIFKTQTNSLGTAIPPYVFLFGILGSTIKFFETLALSENYFEKNKLINELKLASIRIILAGLLVVVLYFLLQSSNLDLAFNDRVLAGFSFLVGMYTTETIVALFGIADNTFSRIAVLFQGTFNGGQNDECERCGEENNANLVIEGEVVCLECLTTDEREEISALLA